MANLVSVVRAKAKALTALHWIVLGSFVLRFVGSASERLWYDETFTAALIRPGVDFWRALVADTHPPVWYLLELATSRIFGFSELALRLPAIGISSLIPVLVWFICGRLQVSSRLRITASTLSGFLPAFVYYGTDARMYSLLSLLVLFALLSALRGNWYLFFIAGIGACYTHNVGAIYVLCIGLASLATRRTLTDLAKCAVACSLCALCYVPWFAFVVLGQASQITNGGWWVPPITPPGTFWAILLDTAGWRLPGWFQAPIYGLVLFTIGIGTITLRRTLTTRSGVVFSAAMIAAPLVFIGVCLAIVNIYVYRALLPSAYLLTIPMGAALLRFSRRSQLATIGMFTLALGFYPFYGQREDIRAFIAPAIGSTPIYYLNATDSLEFGYYAHNPSYVYPSVSTLISIRQQARIAFDMQQRFMHVGASEWYVVYTQSPFSDRWRRSYFEAILRSGRAKIVGWKHASLTDTWLILYRS